MQAPEPVVIRSPSPRDLPGLASLLGELGYPASPSAVESRLKRMGAHAEVVVFVADRGGVAVGVATGHRLDVIHHDTPVAMLSAMVVAATERGRGTGRALVDAVETWAISSGARRITVASGLAREGAHAFYERLGYELTARRYAKMLAPR
jgi:predicted N-acetyltransferase YhbS